MRARKNRQEKKDDIPRHDVQHAGQRKDGGKMPRFRNLLPGHTYTDTILLLKGSFCRCRSYGHVMKIVFAKNEMVNAVPPLLSGVSGKAALTVSEGILFEAQAPDICRMTTFDMEKGVRLTVHAEVIEEGAAIISASKFTQTVRAMEDGDITLSVDDRNAVSITCGSASHTMNALPAADFPDLPRLRSANGFTVPRRTLRAMIGKCMHAMGSIDQRPFLNGMYMCVTDGKLDTVACDSFRLAVCSTPADIVNCNENGSDLYYRFILPNKSVGELYRLLDTKGEGGEEQDEPLTRIHMFRKNIVFDLDGIVFFSRLIDSEYMDYNRIIVRNHRITVTVDRDLLLGALERAALITEERVPGAVRSSVRLDVTGDMLKVSAVSGLGSSYDEMPIRHEGDDLTIAFNNRYLMDSLRACRAGDIRLSMSSALSSINIEPVLSEEEAASGESELFFLLPVRTKE